MNALGVVVGIQHDFFGGFDASFPAAIDGIVLALDNPAVVPIPPIKIGYIAVVLLDSSFHFVEKLLLQRFCRGEHGFRVAIFGTQVVQDFCVFTLVKPEVRVHQGIPVDYRGMGPWAYIGRGDLGNKGQAMAHKQG